MRASGVVNAALVAALTCSAGRAAAQPPAPTTAAPTVESLQGDLEQIRAQLAEQQMASEAERMALLDMMTSSQTPQLEEPKLQIYGFMDMGFQRYLLDDVDDVAIFPTEKGTFVSGNTNIYFDARPLEKWRGLVETRLSLLPHGTYTYTQLGALPRQNNAITDLSSSSGRERVQWGSIIMERAQIEYTWSSQLRLVAGYFLTPWGIWNIDHATPTLISLMLPSFQVEAAVPQHLTGVQLTGSFVGPPWELGYFAHVTNGRTPILFDLTDDKAYGGRVYLRYSGEDLTIMLGASTYYGRSEDEDKIAKLDPVTLAINLEKALKYRFTEFSNGLDLSIDWLGFRLRSEGLIRRVEYKKGKRETAYGVLGGHVPDHSEHFAYVTLAYRRLAVEPYFYYEIKRTGAANAFLPDDAWAVSGGLNVYFSASTQLKIQYANIFFQNLRGDYRPQLVTSRLVLSF